jgi:hypothetical protein
MHSRPEPHADLVQTALDLLLRESKRSIVDWLGETTLFRKEMERLKSIGPAHRRAVRTGNAAG